MLRVRSDLETTRIFFDRVCAAGASVPAASLSLTPPSSGSVGRISWETFVSALSKSFGHTVATVPVIELDGRPVRHDPAVTTVLAVAGGFPPLS